MRKYQGKEKGEPNGDNFRWNWKRLQAVFDVYEAVNGQLVGKVDGCVLS